jgi:beta-lactamase superfamily II metal-dependent hydrolase
MRSNRNDSGYALKITRAGGDVLLSGDLPYSKFPPGIGTQFVAIAVTHHGGASTGSPPTPSSRGAIAAVSYGQPNRYHHPDPTSIGLHQSAGWAVSPTYVSARRRGDVWL